MPAKTLEQIAQILQHIRFKRKLLGGVDEDDVWRIIDKLQQEYAAVLDAQAAGYNALLAERDRYIAELESLQGGADTSQAEVRPNEQTK